VNIPLRRASLRQSVAGEVRAHLARRRLSGRQAALRLGWTQPYMSRRLTGDVPFDVADLEAIGDLLGVRPEVFFLGPDDDEEAPGVNSARCLTALVAA
jgi:transcriptional regulator with XRE-family HTH domain